ncbi:hypothetical protein [Leptospira ilyithenensis]|uniref:Uncharacterized protein n=1 Tax=Leptospira ilyithenensis TaxID=2484901 RepID=A0A4R9LUN0_9LEPT|nr:hypothetical protein [Leptospira ilyithenensis]TGN14615.1 hypothetical protein EHS11_01090 [Leptospira ilyithenensis]
MDSILFLKSASIFYHIGFAIFHIFFWKIFSWKKSLQKINIADKAILQILNLCLILVFFFFASLMYWIPTEVLESNFGLLIVGFILLFWALRFIYQFIFLPQNNRLVLGLNLIFFLGILIHSVFFWNLL